jgi:hypothetical protein
MNAIQAKLRNPILWLVIAIPLATLFGGYETLRLAYQSGGSDEVPGEVTRTGQAQVAELSPDREAAQAGLRVSITFDPVAGRITATQDAGRRLTTQPIELQLIHPLHADEDRSIALLPAGLRWQAAMPRLADNDWQLVLTDADNHWRLIGRLPRHAAVAALQPSLPP